MTPGEVEAIRMVVEGVGAIALLFIGFVVNDLRGRVMRIENILLTRKP